MNDKLREELEKTNYKGPRSKVLLTWIVVIIALTFFFFIIPPIFFKNSSSSSIPTLPANREIVRLELNKDWSVPVKPPPGKCIWYEFAAPGGNAKVTAQRAVGNSWKFWDQGTQYTFSKNRFRAAYEYAWLYYEVRNNDACQENTRTAPDFQITVRWELKNHWSYPLKVEKGNCIKWWAAEDQNYAVNVSHTWGSDQFYDWDGPNFVEPESGWKFFKIRFGGRNDAHPTVFSLILPAGQCRD